MFASRMIPFPSLPPLRQKREALGGGVLFSDPLLTHTPSPRPNVPNTHTQRNGNRQGNVRAVRYPALPPQRGSEKAVNGRGRFGGNTAASAEDNGGMGEGGAGQTGTNGTSGSRNRAPCGQHQRQTAGDNVHEMYEARLAALERRLGATGSDNGTSQGKRLCNVRLNIDHLNQWGIISGVLSGPFE